MNIQEARDLLLSYLRARYSLIAIRSPEEERVLREIRSVANARQFKVACWSIRRGFFTPEGQPIQTRPDTKGNPQEALERIAEWPERAVIVLLDFTPYLQDPIICRYMREVSLALTRTPADKARTIIMLSADAKLPDSMPNEGASMEWPLPDRAELGTILDTLVRGLPEERRPKLEVESRNASIQAALGLTAQEAASVWSRSLVDSGEIEAAKVASEKKQAVSRDGILEWVDAEMGLDQIGGLDLLKKWLIERKLGFTQKARERLVPVPKGLIAVGAPGCGKSLMAKVTSIIFGIPLVRLDMGRLYGGLVGQSESNTRKALATIGAIAPCVLWADEVEKGLSSGSGFSDGGVSKRVLGTLLTWQQEQKSGVFFFATANNVKALPPEFLRKGR